MNNEFFVHQWVDLPTIFFRDWFPRENNGESPHSWPKESWFPLDHIWFYILPSQRPMFIWPTWGPPRSHRPQVGPMYAPWALLSGLLPHVVQRWPKPCCSHPRNHKNQYVEYAAGNLMVLWRMQGASLVRRRQTMECTTNITSAINICHTITFPTAWKM